MKTTLSALLLLTLLNAGCKTRDAQTELPEESALVLSSTVLMGDPKAAIQLVRGFYEIEQSSWRWTAGKFSVRLKTPPNAMQQGAKLIVNFVLPESVTARIPVTTLTAAIKGTAIGSAVYKSPGDKVFEPVIPAALLAGDAVTVDFELDKFLAAGSVDTRELGLVVSSIGLEAK